LPHEEVSLLQRAVDAVTGTPTERERTAFEALPPAVQSIARAIAPLVVYTQDEPLARMEWVDTGTWITP
jgi:hypothetical protein